MIADLQDSYFDVTFTGFNPPEIEQLMNNVHDKEIDKYVEIWYKMIVCKTNCYPGIPIQPTRFLSYQRESCLVSFRGKAFLEYAGVTVFLSRVKKSRACACCMG